MHKVLTVRQETAKAKIVFVCAAANARGSAENGTAKTDLYIEHVIKGHQLLAKTKLVTINKLIASQDDEPVQLIVWCDVRNGINGKPNIASLEPYRGMFVGAGDVAKYVATASAQGNQPPAKRLAFFYEHLDHGDPQIIRDALSELLDAKYDHLVKLAKRLEPDTILKQLNGEIIPSKVSLYGKLLGASGMPKHAQLLSRVIDKHYRAGNGGIDGLLVGLTVLDANMGWNKIAALMKNKKAEFLDRYAVLQAIRFLRNNCAAVDAKKVVGAIALLLDHPDMTDFAMEELRKMKRWEMTKNVLQYSGKKGFEAAVTKRAILRFALQSPRAEAIDFVGRQIAADPVFVEETLELLELEE